MQRASIPGGGRSILGRSPLARLPDRVMKYGLTALAALILALIVYFFIRLVGEARPAFASEGVVGFVFHNNWNVNGSLELGYFDNAFTSLSPRQFKQYKFRTAYKPRPWATIRFSHSPAAVLPW